MRKSADAFCQPSNQSPLLGGQELLDDEKLAPFAKGGDLNLTQAGMETGIFNRFHAFALIEAFADDKVGKVYLEQIMEPALKAFSDKLRGTPVATRDEAELRAATLLASAPLLLLGLHQDVLGGKDKAPIDMDKTFGFLKEWLTTAFTAA